MNVTSSAAQSYQSLNSFQKPQTVTPPISTLPITPDLSPEEKRENQTEAVDAFREYKSDSDANKEAQRTFAAGVIDRQSKQTRVEIYLAVATGSEVDVKNDTISVLESLRDVQKQNNTVAAYATYQDNQNSLVNY